MTHRVRTIKQYKISDSVLISILEKLDPVSLYRTCETFERVYDLVRDFQHLHYRRRLAIVGMKDGPAPYASRPLMIRIQLLMSYKKNWPRLKWADEQKISVPLATHVEVSGNFLYYPGAQSLDLLELPSCRLGRLPPQTRPFHYVTNPKPESVAVDALQSLIIAAHTIGAPNGQIGLRLKIRNLLNFDKHPKALASSYDRPTDIAQPVSKVSTALCGTRVVCTVEFVGGLVKHLLIDWTTFQAMWFEEQDVILLSAHRLLGVRKNNGKMALYLYNLCDMRNVTIEREYELPPIWAKSTMRFGRNAAENTDLSRSSPALFYCDPSARVLVLTAKQSGPNGAAMHWMMINESFFRPTSIADRRSVPWSYWSQFCLIKELSPVLVRGEPHVVGNRVVYLEKDGTRSASGAECTRLRIIDFAPFPEIAPASLKTWTLIGKYSALRPGECHRDFPPTTTNGLAVENICATEDNVILSLEGNGNIRPVNVLTFGSTPLTTKSIHRDQYHPTL